MRTIEDDMYDQAFGKGVKFAKQWINIEVGLPEDHETVLFFDGNCEVICLGWYNRKNNTWNEERRFGENVKYWMPLPEHPNK